MSLLARLGAWTFATRGRLAALLVAYLALHAAARLWLLPAGLGYDDAEQILSAQRWAWLYRYEQPPLVTWLLLALTRASGLEPGLAALTLLRSLMLGALYLFTYLAARQWLGEPRLAGLAAAGLAATYTLGWLAHGDLPHSTLLAVMVAAALWLWMRLLARPTLARTLALAIVCGLGLLAKWNFVMLAAGFVVVGLLRPTTRHLVLSWRLPLVAVVMALIAAPSAFAVVGQEADLGQLGREVLVVPAEAAAATGWLAGLGALGLSALAFPQPLLGLAAVVLWPARRAPSRDAVWLLALMGVLLALHAVLIPLAGAVNFPERWMIVPLLAVPIALVAACRPSHPRLDLWGGVLIVLALAVLLIRIGIGVTDAAYCGKCRNRLPAADFARGLEQAGFREGTIVAFDMHLAGNLKRHLPEARVVVPQLPASAWPAPGQGRCAVVWRGQREAPPRSAAFGADWSAAPTHHVAAPILGSEDRVQHMAFRVVDGEGACR